MNNLDSTFAALADPTRRAMVTKLTCLVRAQIVVKQRRGRESICTLRPAAIESVANWALDFRRLWEESFDKLDTVLQEMKNKETTHGK